MKTVRIGLASLLGLAVLAAIWGLVEPYTISVERHEVPLDGLAAAWEGEQVAVVSDFQIGIGPGPSGEP